MKTREIALSYARSLRPEGIYALDFVVNALRNRNVLVEVEHYEDDAVVTLGPPEDRVLFVVLSWADITMPDLVPATEVASHGISGRAIVGQLDQKLATRRWDSRRALKGRR